MIHTTDLFESFSVLDTLHFLTSSSNWLSIPTVSSLTYQEILPAVIHLGFDRMKYSMHIWGWQRKREREIQWSSKQWKFKTLKRESLWHIRKSETISSRWPESKSGRGIIEAHMYQLYSGVCNFFSLINLVLALGLWVTEDLSSISALPIPSRGFPQSFSHSKASFSPWHKVQSYVFFQNCCEDWDEVWGLPVRELGT